jgi:hypothetical protein
LRIQRRASTLELAPDREQHGVRRALVGAPAGGESADENVQGGGVDGRGAQRHYLSDLDVVEMRGHGASMTWNER